MSQAVWLFLGGLATVASSSLAVRNRESWRLRVGGEALAIMLWMVWAINAFSVYYVDQSGTRHLMRNRALGYIGLLIVLALVADLLAVVLDLLGEDAQQASAG